MSDLTHIPALSLSRPWTKLVLDGLKPIENRGWRTHYRGPVIVHGAKSFDRAAGDTAHVAAAMHRRWFLLDEHVERAYAEGYLGVVMLDDVCDRLMHTENGWPATSCECGPWAFGDRYHFHVSAPRWFDTPIPGPGHQKLFRPPEHVQQLARQVLEQAA